MRASPCPAFTWAAVIAALSLGCSDFSDLQTDKDSRVAVLDRSVAGESSIIVDASGAPDRAAAVDSSAGPDTKRPPDLGEVPDGPWTIPASPRRPRIRE